MAETLKFVYQELETMISILQDSARQLESSITNLNTIAGNLEQGALIGNTGDALARAVRQDLNAAINRLKLKLDEDAKDLRQSVDMMKRTDGIVGSKFQ